MTTMSSTGAAVNFQGEARVALRGAGLAWIVMGLLTLLAAWNISQGLHRRLVGIRPDQITVPVLIVELVFGLALICAGIFPGVTDGPHMSASDWAISGSSARSFSSFLFSRSPSCRSPWGTARFGWRIPDGGAAMPPRRAWEGGDHDERTGLPLITCLGIGPVAGLLLGFVFGWLMTAFMVIAGLKTRHGALRHLRGLLSAACRWVPARCSAG